MSTLVTYFGANGKTKRIAEEFANQIGVAKKSMPLPHPYQAASGRPPRS